jgi:hypothetical protein
VAKARTMHIAANLPADLWPQRLIRVYTHPQRQEVSIRIRTEHPERSASNSPSQNDGTERSGGGLRMKAHWMRIVVNLPADLWPEVVNAAG